MKNIFIKFLNNIENISLYILFYNKTIYYKIFKMVFFRELKCIFIHIPKTAGTSIEQFLKDNKNEIEYLGVRNNRSLQHLTALELSKEIPYVFKIYYKFSFVRNPYDRLLSVYYWTPIPNVGYKYGKTKAEFLNFVTNLIKNKRFFNNVYVDHFAPQYLFLYGNRKLLVDEVFKYEKLDESVKYLKEKFGINNELPILNKSKTKKEDWNERQKERIYKLYMTDFIIFGYNK